MRLLLSPRYWGGHLLMAVCVGIAATLGFWQYDAWREHRAAEARDISAAEPVALNDVMSGDDPFMSEDVGKPVRFTGSWMPDSTVYVSGRPLDGKRGFWVVTPVLVDGSGSAMPVVRGWAPRAESEPVTGAADVTGWLQPGEGSGVPDDDPHDDVVPEMRIASLVEHVDNDLYGAFVVTRDTEEPGLAQVTPASIPEVSSTTGLRNLLYAVEWWVFGAFALFIWGRWCRDSLVVAEPEQIPSEP